MRAQRDLGMSSTRDVVALATGPFGVLSHDELGEIADTLADPLRPVDAVSLSSTCKGLRMPLWAGLAALEQLHGKARKLCHKVGMSPTELATTNTLSWSDKLLTAEDVGTVSMLLPWLPRVKFLFLGCPDASSMRALCEGMARDAAPQLELIHLAHRIDSAGALSLAAALRTGALPKLRHVWLEFGLVDSQGMAALSASLRMLPSLTNLHFWDIGDEHVGLLLANLSANDFEVLEGIRFDSSNLTDVGCRELIAALDARVLPAILWFNFSKAVDISSAVSRKLTEALVRAHARQQHITLALVPYEEEEFQLHLDELEERLHVDPASEFHLLGDLELE